MIARTRRHLAALVLVLVGSVVLSGCIEIKISSTYHADDTVDCSGSSVYDAEYVSEMGVEPAEIAAQTADSFAEQIAAAGVPSDSFTSEPYLGDDGSAGVAYTMTGITPEQLFAIMATSDGGDGGEGGDLPTYSHTDGTITLTSGSASAPTGEEGAMTIDPEEAGITVEERLTFPGPVQSTTLGAIDPDDPNTVIVTDPTQLMSGAPWELVASDSADGAAPPSEQSPAEPSSEASPTATASAVAVAASIESDTRSTLGLQIMFAVLAIALVGVVAYGGLLVVRSRH